MSAPHPDFDSLPEALREPPRRAWQDMIEHADRSGSGPPTIAPELLNQLPRVWACSEFVARQCARAPGLLADLLDSGDLRRAYPPGSYAQRVARALADSQDEATLGRALRRLRNREMVRIAWRDLAGEADLKATVANLSDLADTCLDEALSRLDGWLRERFGTPTNARGEPQRMVVLGMGKLGGQELNFSSDIDLVLAFPEPGSTRGGRRTVDNSEYFNRLGRSLITALDANTEDGFVFRVDMRLRPFGNAGPLTIGFDAMEHYYQHHGRDWERYAMIKARAVAGDREQGEHLLQLLRPFVYRRYLDFGAFEALRAMKTMIRKEVQRKQMQTNIKLGPGGIREIEFIAQAFQIVRGGQDPGLRDRRLLPVLERLGGQGLLPPHGVRSLSDAYVFLRDLEHRLQERRDQQTQVLPEAPEERAILALGMGCADWPRLAEELEQHRRRVAEVFEQVFAAPQTDAHGDTGHTDLKALWQGLMEDEQALEALAEVGLDAPSQALSLLQRLRESRAVRTLGAAGRARLDQLMPLLLGACAASNTPTTTLERLLGIVEAIGGRSAYLALLVENPMALSQLAKLCAASPWIADQVARHPLLLDELIDPRSLYAPPDRAGLEAELKRALEGTEDDDLELQMDILRRFQHANQLRVAAADVAGGLPITEVSDRLSYLAEVVLQAVLEIAWRPLSKRHGVPPCEIDGQPCETGFAVIGYGKLGGMELGYGSDLDIVFVHGAEAGATRGGVKPIDGNVYYARLAQRMIHILTAHTPAGRLYETDLRLRPSGASGPTVSSLETLSRYQREQAWTWEHQALVRARPVAGDRLVGNAFQALRREILSLRRDPATLRGRVREMRLKMRQALGSGSDEEFDLKQDPGGIADIEFITQYGVLRWACDHPRLLDHTDNIRLLDAFAKEGLMPAESAAGLIRGYRTLRAEVHRMSLRGTPARAAATAFPNLRAQVLQVWDTWLEEHRNTARNGAGGDQP